MANVTHVFTLPIPLGVEPAPYGDLFRDLTALLQGIELQEGDRIHAEYDADAAEKKWDITIKRPHAETIASLKGE